MNDLFFTVVNLLLEFAFFIGDVPGLDGFDLKFDLEGTLGIDLEELLIPLDLNEVDVEVLISFFITLSFAVTPITKFF